MNERNDDFLSIDEVAMMAHTTTSEVMLKGNRDGKTGWFKQNIHLERAMKHLQVDDTFTYDDPTTENLQHALTRIAMELYRRKQNEKV